MTTSELDYLIQASVSKTPSEQANPPSKGRKFQLHDYFSIIRIIVRILDFLKIDFMDIVMAMQSLFTSWWAEFFLKFKLIPTKKPDNQTVLRSEIIRLLLGGEYRIRTDDPLPARQVL